MKVCPECRSMDIKKSGDIWIYKKCGWKGKKPEEISEEEAREIKKKEKREKKMKKLEKRMRRLGY